MATAASNFGRVAVLVIHGIGEQSPYEALDGLGRGLAERFQIPAGSLEHHVRRREDRTESMVRMPLRAQFARELDLHEFHWAPLVQGRITLRQVLAWLLRTSVTPLGMLARQWEVLALEPGAGRGQWLLAIREFLRALALVLVVGVIALPFGIVALWAHRFVEAGPVVTRLLREGGGASVALAAALLLAAMGGAMLVGQWHLPRFQDRADRRWRAISIGLGGATVVLAAVVGWWGEAGPLLGALLGALRGAPLAALVATVISLVLRRLLIRHVGDITIYVTADENSAFARTRREVLKGATGRLRQLLLDSEYDAVYLAGHSLGSVIAYDAINHLIREVQAEPAGGALSLAHLERLRGLLTFGSPLDKVNYFFRIQVDGRQPIRAQIISLLHAFRKRGSARDYGALAFATPKFKGLQGLRWLNVWSYADIVSGRLDFYQVDEQRQLTYIRPFAAHFAYWGDRRFHALLGAWLQ
jgi:hypothetical protein